jgi:hypothetical protein
MRQIATGTFTIKTASTTCLYRGGKKQSPPTTASSPQLAVLIAWISEQTSIALDLAKAVRQVKWQTIQVRHARSWRPS